MWIQHAAALSEVQAQYGAQQQCQPNKESYISIVFNPATYKHIKQLYGSRLPKCGQRIQRMGVRKTNLHQQMHHHYFISSSIQIVLCSKHCFELLVSTIIAICHCCIHPFVKSSEGARRWTNCPFISCKGMKKIGHLVCWDHAAALGISIYNIVCNKCKVDTTTELVCTSKSYSASERSLMQMSLFSYYQKKDGFPTTE